MPPLRRLAALVAVLALGSWAPAIGYTVQVAALSDADAALQVSQALLRDGFPAYVVRAEGGAGSVYRVRVGAFGDRATAERYAISMGRRAGGEPQPALAEAIPSGILPLAPARLFEVPSGTDASLHAWGEAVALRLAAEAGPARYALEDGTTFQAWWAAAEGETRVAVAPLRLGGAEAQDDPDEVREAVLRQRLALLGERSGIAADALADAVREAPWSDVPYLVAYHRGALDGTGMVLGIAAGTAPPDSRRPGDWLGATPPEPRPPLWRPSADADGEVAGDGWRAVPDGEHVRLEAASTAWRALVGTPVWGADDVLVVRLGDGYEVVQLSPR